MAITRWEPFGSELRHLQEAIDRMFEEPFLAPTMPGGRGFRMLPLDIYETPDAVIVKTTLAGVKPEDVDISVSGNVLTIRAERKRETRTPQGAEPIREERFYGRFERVITLPVAVQADKAQATFDNGELTLRLPKAEESKAKHIKVQAKAQQAS